MPTPITMQAALPHNVIARSPHFGRRGNLWYQETVHTEMREPKERDCHGPLPWCSQGQGRGRAEARNEKPWGSEIASSGQKPSLLAMTGGRLSVPEIAASPKMRAPRNDRTEMRGPFATYGARPPFWGFSLRDLFSFSSLRGSVRGRSNLRAPMVCHCEGLFFSPVAISLLAFPHFRSYGLSVPKIASSGQKTPFLAMTGGRKGSSQ